MVRLKIEDKQKAIIEAAITVFAERGFWNTPTSLISRTAGVADGTLFNYFETKDELINAVYLVIKQEVAAQLLDGLSSLPSFKDKMWQIWSRYIDWGVAHPDKFKVLRQIGESAALDPEVEAKCLELFNEIARISHESIVKNEIRPYPEDYLAALVDQQSSMTVEYIAATQDKQTDYKQIGFDILWNGLIR